MLKRKTLAIDTGIDIGGNQGCLDKKCARATHGIHEGRTALPAAFQDDAGGKNLIDGSIGLSHFVTALMQRLA